MNLQKRYQLVVICLGFNNPASRTSNIVCSAHEELTDLFLVAQNALVIEEAGHYL